MKVISIHSHKGGAGKTTLALMTARRLAENGRKVCLVDLDFLGAGVDPAITMQRPKHYLEELLLASAGSKQSPKIKDLLGRHNVGPGAKPIALILNTGHQSPATPADEGQDRPASLHTGVVRLLGLEEQTGIVERRMGSLLGGLKDLGFDYVILDCHPTLEEISETVLRVQMARPPENAAIVLVSTADRAHVHGLLKEMLRRTKSPSGVTLDLNRTVLVVNKVEGDEEKRPYRSTLASFTELAEELKSDPVVGDEAPLLTKSVRPGNYCRILRHDLLTSRAFAVGSSGEIPRWPVGILTHSGTPLCEELFGPK